MALHRENPLLQWPRVPLSALWIWLAALSAAPVGVGAQSIKSDTRPAEVAAAAGPSTLRFASLKSDRVNLRSGPGTEYPTVWVFRRAGLPLEIMKEFEGWRQVRDADGATGWVLQHFLSGRRTALVMPWEVKANTPPLQIDLYADDSERARVVARIEAGVIANVMTCDGAWCRVSIEPYRGYLPQKRLWGVYEGEQVK